MSSSSLYQSRISWRAESKGEIRIVRVMGQLDGDERTRSEESEEGRGELTDALHDVLNPLLLLLDVVRQGSPPRRGESKLVASRGNITAGNPRVPKLERRTKNDQLSSSPACSLK